MEMGFVEGLCLRLVVLHCLELVCLVIKLELDFIATIVFEKLIGLFMLYHVFGLSMKCCFCFMVPVAYEIFSGCLASTLFHRLKLVCVLRSEAFNEFRFDFDTPVSKKLLLRALC